MASLLIVEDEPVLVHQLAVALRTAGHEVETAGTASEGLLAAEKFRPDLVLLDLRLPDRLGLNIIPELLARDPALMIILMTAYGSNQDSLEAIRLGAVDYLNKPLDVGELGGLIERHLVQQRQRRELAYLRKRRGFSIDPKPDGLVAGDGGPLAQVFARIARFCDPSLPAGKRPAILLEGACEHAKAEIAASIHERFGAGPMIALHCGEFSTAELAEELFGAEAAGVGTSPSSPGLLEAAEGGTLFLEDVGSLPEALQGDFLRVLSEQRCRRVGGERDRQVNVHVLAGTREALTDRSRANRLNPALMRELSSLCFSVPSLRERREELPDLARSYARRAGLRFDGRPRTLADDAVALLLAHPWPGNLAELHNVLKRGVWFSPGDEIGAELLETLLAAGEPGPRPGEIVLPEDGLRMEDVERDLLRQALLRTKGNQTRASALLGLSRDTLRYRITKLGLEGLGSEGTKTD